MSSETCKLQTLSRKSHAQFDFSFFPAAKVMRKSIFGLKMEMNLLPKNRGTGGSKVSKAEESNHPQPEGRFGKEILVFVIRWHVW